MSKELKTERNRDLINVFFEIKKRRSDECGFVSDLDCMEEAVNSPAKKFYITYERAARFISLLERGIELPISNEKKKMMYGEIHRRFTKRKHEKRATMYDVLVDILQEDAPCFYIDAHTMNSVFYANLKDYLKCT